MRSYIFVDNSNVFIEGQKAAAIATDSVVKGKLYRLDFGRLFKHLTPEDGTAFFQVDGEYFPKLYGSEPPKLDSLWRILKDMGVGVKVFQRNPRGIEKRVDAALIIDVSRLIYKLRPKPDGEIVIVAGDLDYYDLVFLAKNAGWKVRITCWHHATAGPLQSLSVWEDLTPSLETVGFFEKYRFDHDYGDWEPTDWSKEVPYREEKKRRRTH